jgi:hypothetical protein
MVELLTLAAVYVEISDSKEHPVKFIILGEQGEEIAALSLDSALSITEVTQAFMEWEGKPLSASIH